MNIAGAVAAHSAAQPHAVAAVADGETLTYAGFAAAAARFGSWLAERRMERVSLLASRSIGGWIGVVGAAWSGVTYVPLSLKTPTARLAAMLAQVRAGALLVDRHGAAHLDAELLAAVAPAVVVAADEVTRSMVEPVCGEVPVLAELDAAPRAPLEAPTGAAYIIFTSGTTGLPKGVVVSFEARAALLAQLIARYRLRPEDRVAETADLSFDISVANMLLAWSAGASLHAVPATAMVAPARFIRANAITVWCSVPTVIATMRRAGALRPGILPSLRYSMFIGEALPVASAEWWQVAAPGSRIDNLYGPTEVCFGCFGHRFDACAPSAELGVSIGKPFATTRAMIVDAGRDALEAGRQGELAIGGAQLADGYLDNPELTAARFPVIGGRRWYLTGDAVRMAEDGSFHHIGRIDNQLKVLGYRVELEDVENHLRSFSGAISAAVMPCPPGAAAARSLVGFVVGSTRDAEQIRHALVRQLPAYMIPDPILRVDALPLSPNGKLDRRRLVELLPHG